MVSGRLSVRFKVAPEGSVAWARSERATTFTSAAAVTCALSTVQRLKFPPAAEPRVFDDAIFVKLPVLPDYSRTRVEKLGAGDLRLR
jgi:hypothetical protein